MLDFLILYEHKSRELENICLLRVELERRGYTVGFYNVSAIYGKGKRCFKAKVVITSALYADVHLQDFVYEIAPGVRKVVNLQWEQVYTEQTETMDCVYNVKGLATQAVHISWGRNNQSRLIGLGVPEKKAVICGPIHMDFLRPEFAGYYYSRDLICDKYNIPREKEICLFISSFSYNNRPKETLVGDREALGEYFDAFYDASMKSMDVMLEWIERILDERKDLVFIYRPHPAELEVDQLFELSKRNERFYIIRDFSVKQWILACDRIYTWYSTSIVEAYFAKKKCQILRPVHIDEKSDVIIFKGAEMITSYQAFTSSFNPENDEPTVNRELISEYYDFDEQVPSYIRICNLLESVYKDDEYNIPPYEMKKKSLQYKLRYSSAYLKPMMFLGEKYKKQNTKGIPSWLKTRLIKMGWLSEEMKKNIASGKEIEQQMQRIRKVLYG